MKNGPSRLVFLIPPRYFSSRLEDRRRKEKEKRLRNVLIEKSNTGFFLASKEASSERKGVGKRMAEKAGERFQTIEGKIPSDPSLPSLCQGGSSVSRGSNPLVSGDTSTWGLCKEGKVFRRSIRAPPWTTGGVQIRTLPDEEPFVCMGLNHDLLLPRRSLSLRSSVRRVAVPWVERARRGRNESKLVGW